VSRILLDISAVGYLAATAAYALHFARPGQKAGVMAPWLLMLGFLVHSVATAARFARVGTPVLTFDQGLSFFAWLLVGIYLVVRRQDRHTVIGAVVSPLACALTLASVALYNEGATPVPAELRSPWLPVHVTLAFLGNAVFALAFAISVVYLVQERSLKSHQSGWMIRRLPSLEQLDQLNFRCLAWGFPLLTLGILTGGVWAAHAWGRFWSWEPREVLSLLTWIIYAGLLQFRMTAGLRGRRAATLTIVGFALVIVSFISINVLQLPGRHGSGAGS
jgi:cytochrome c-type biogenesis protein CcsB